MGKRISLSRPYFDAQELEAVQRVLDSGWVVQGPEVEAFESRIAALHRAQHCIAVSSGTAALHIGYLALGIGPGAAVFIPSFAWPSAANMAKLVGAEPVFVDVLAGTYNLDPFDLERQIEKYRSRQSSNPAVIVPVHEFGLAADMDRVLAIASRHSAQVMEDAACALGASYGRKPVGTLGSLGVFSFHPRKSITTGEGGAIVTNDAELAELCRSWRNHGQRLVAGGRDFLLPGLNYRMTEMQAALGSAQLRKFEEILQKRRAVARRYLAGLVDCKELLLPSNSVEHTWQTFMVMPHQERSTLVQHFAQRDIEVGPGSVAAHLGAHFQPQPSLPVAEKLHRHGVALPLHAGLSPGEVDCVIEVLREQLKAAPAPTVAPYPKAWANNKPL